MLLGLDVLMDPGAVRALNFELPLYLAHKKTLNPLGPP
jgi:hypothetical protein